MSWPYVTLMRFTFVVAGWPSSVHDMSVFNDAHDKYADKFPHPPQGICVSWAFFTLLNCLHVGNKILNL